MKKQSQSRFNNIELFKAMDNFEDCDSCRAMLLEKDIESPYMDTRFYGIFLVGDAEHRRIKVDIKRFIEKIGLQDDIKAVTDKRTSHYFIPAKRRYYEYNCNEFVEAIQKIRLEWQEEFKPIIEQITREVKDAAFQFDDLLGSVSQDDDMSGYSSIMKHQAQSRAEPHRVRIDRSLYAQFFHQMVSKIDAVTAYVLSKHGLKKCFSRNDLYSFRHATKDKVEQLDGFKHYDTMYAVWNFLKHNSTSTYETLKKVNQRILPKTEYHQGDLAVGYVRLSDELVQRTLQGVEKFFKEYCKLVFNEDYEIAQWNFDDFFLRSVNAEIKIVKAPSMVQPFLKPKTPKISTAMQQAKNQKRRLADLFRINKKSR